jgi:TolB-like protein/tRNA A-37 threonylcarbamoyl transferase component Bud32/tetratricopeptide (TPR) repeat protein
MPSSLDRIKIAIADHYEIERELGHGAMATVYLAHDLKLNRRVAVKVLLPELGFVLGPERFRREIELATKLSHPHILPIYDSGEADGQLYYVMPYVAGETLRWRLNRERQLPLDEALRIAAEVASALDHSHRHGIIHRDIKPENILLEDGQALVADFGIARAVSAVGEGKLTSTGVSLGTPTYMSPEQGMADPNLDGRTDIYSLGCVLYEMLAGSPPFTGRTTQALIARHSLDAVPSLTIVRQTIPEEVEDVVLCALAKVPADRFSTAGEFAEALTAVRQGGTSSVRRTRAGKARKSKEKKWGVIALAVALGVLAITGAAWAGKALIWDARRNATTNAGAGGFKPQRIAVLYFKDLSPDKRLGYLADGLTESLINQLGQVSALDVISTGGVKQFRGEDISRDSIAHTLEAGTLVDGSVTPEGKNVRVTMRIIDGNSGADFDEPKTVVESLGNPLALRTKLAEQLSLMLRVWLRDEIRLRELRAGTQNPTAWSLVQRAEKMRKDADLVDQSGNPAAAARQLLAADTLLAQAETLDPKWTEPIVLQGRIAGRQEQLSSDPAEAAKWINVGIAYADSAIALDPRDADALELRGSLRVRPIVRGFVEDQRRVDDLVQSATNDLRQAIAVNPTQAGALNVLSAIQYLKHDPVESHTLAQRAYEADAYLTAAPEILWRLYATSYDLEQFVNAKNWCDEATKRFPQHVRAARCQLWIMTAKGIRPDPIEALRRAADYERAAPPQQREYFRREGQIVVADVLGRAGLPDSARHVLVRARADRTIDPRGELMGYEAFVRAQLGDKKEAVDLLQRYLADHPEHRGGFAKVNAWWWRDLQSDPRFKTLIATGG